MVSSQMKTGGMCGKAQNLRNPRSPLSLALLPHLLSIILRFPLVFCRSLRPVGGRVGPECWLWRARWKGSLWEKQLTLNTHSEPAPPTAGVRMSVLSLIICSIDHRMYYVCRGSVSAPRDYASLTDRRGKKNKQTPERIKVWFASHSLKKDCWKKKTWNPDRSRLDYKK